MYFICVIVNNLEWMINGLWNCKQVYCLGSMMNWLGLTFGMYLVANIARCFISHCTCTSHLEKVPVLLYLLPFCPEQVAWNQLSNSDEREQQADGSVDWL